jgi:hypothetical protein
VCIAPVLADIGYALENPTADLHPSWAVRFMMFCFLMYFDLRIWLKSNTQLSRISDRKIKGLQTV